MMSYKQIVPNFKNCNVDAFDQQIGLIEIFQTVLQIYGKERKGKEISTNVFRN